MIVFFQPPLPLSLHPSLLHPISSFLPLPSSLHPFLPPSPRETGPRCPVDNTKVYVHQLFKDNFAKREVLSLNVHCSADDYGCLWQGELRDLQVLYSTVLYCIVLNCCAVLYCTVLYWTVLYCAVLYCAVLYCTV